MQKIPTIFERNWEGNRKVVDQYVQPFDFTNAIATEKLDGTNVRVTIRNGIVVRLEKRCNPSKLQKAKGIEEPWYVDASETDPADKWIYDALTNTDVSILPDGEWSGEAIGKNVQGDPLGIGKNIIIFFSLGQAPTLNNVPTSYAELKAWLPQQKTHLPYADKDRNIEGIVWHWPDGKMAKIKAKDF